MMRSMNSAVSALKAHQAKMDVIGNNISNVNTHGFKGSRVTFNDVLSQTLRGASSSQGGRSGTNPQQVGLGVSIGAIDTIHTRGTPDRTDVPTDVMINGDGFFIVSDDASFLNRSYTRLGAFTLDNTGNLNLGGYRVLGYRVEEDTIGENPKYGTSLEGLVISNAMTFPAQVTGVSLPYSAADASKERDVRVQGTINADLGLEANVTPKDTSVPADGVPDEWLVSSDKLQTDAHYVTVYDELGGEHELKLTFRRQFKPGFTYDWPSERFTAVPAPGAGGFADINNPNMAEAILPNSWDLIIEPVDGSERISVDGGGPLALVNQTVTFTGGNIDLSRLNIEFSNSDGSGVFANGAGTFNFNLSFEDDKGESSLKQYSTDDTTMNLAALTGYKQGKLSTYNIGTNGEIMAVFTNGQKSPIGQIALAKFKNAAGLQKTQDNLFIRTSNSGTASIGTPGSGGFAEVQSARLEMSNVDLAQEFTTMITTQRGYQANSRVITTTDEMIQELVNLKR